MAEPPGIRTIGVKQYQAAELMIELLSEGEMLSEEIYRLAERRGISDRTVKLVKKMVGIKARRVNNRWYMVLPNGARERFADCVRKPEVIAARSASRRQVNDMVSSDWVAVIANTGEGGVYDTVPSRNNGGLHVKVGAVEFTADSAFPTEKLIEVLRGLGVGNGC